MKPIVLAIMDGIGLRDDMHGNAFKQAMKPNFDFLINEFSGSKLSASGIEVGLPANQMGNSEVGHINIGAGRVVYQPLELINKAIEKGTFYQNKIFNETMNHVIEYDSKLHILGLMSDGGVHSHINHVIALLKMAKTKNIKRVYIHCFMDGRDTLPDQALFYIKQLQEVIKEIGIGEIATIGGRYYGMDRDQRWDRLKLAYDCLTNNASPSTPDINQYIKESLSKGISDEFIVPVIINKEGLICDNDGVIIANFRPDRIIQLGMALTNPSFSNFSTIKFNNLYVSTMMPTSDKVIASHAFELVNLVNTLGAYIDYLGLKQLRIAETEKYAHVTYFFDGGKELLLSNCKRILISSPKVATYDLKPEMSVNEVTDKLLAQLDNNYDLIILNFANGDMVGHTGNLESTVKAIEVMDYNLGRIYKKISAIGGLLIVTADHGNCEYMLDDDNNVITAHTTNKVPFIICNKNISSLDGKLGDIAPTILHIMKLPIPKEMTGNVLIKE